MKSSGLAWCFSAFCCRDDTKVDGVHPEDTEAQQPQNNTLYWLFQRDCRQTDDDNSLYGTTDLLWCRPCWNTRQRSLQWTRHGTSGTCPSRPSPSARGEGWASSEARLQPTHKARCCRRRGACVSWLGEYSKKKNPSLLFLLQPREMYQLQNTTDRMCLWHKEQRRQRDWQVSMVFLLADNTTTRWRFVQYNNWQPTNNSNHSGIWTLWNKSKLQWSLQLC